MKQHRLYEIDLFRFIAAIMVLLFHYSFRGYAADNMSVMPYPLLANLAKYGYLGVHLFFIISGFVILMTASSGSPKRFVISRVVRLYPAFWVCCTMTFLVTAVLGGMRYKVTLGQYLVNMTMLSGFVGVPSIEGTYWSLFVEIKFYLLVFLALILGTIHRAEILLGLWLIATLVLAKWHISYVSYFLIPDYSPYFIVGAMFYIIHRNGISFFRILIVISSYVFATWKATTSEIYDMVSHYGMDFSLVVIISILSVFFSVFFLISTKRIGWFATPRWLFLGALTYPLYLVHENVGFMIFNTLYPFINLHVVMWATVFIMLLFAYSVNRFVEQKYSPRMKHVLEQYTALKQRKTHERIEALYSVPLQVVEFLKSQIYYNKIK
jgi:peptidoglycan/LPS O-acetylase OafA/YrhL